MEISETIMQLGAARFGLDAAALTKLERGGAPDGVVYTYDDARGTFIVKFVPTSEQALPALHARLAFVSYLSDHGIRAPAPLPSPQGNAIEVVEQDDKLWAVTLVHKAPGRHLSPQEWDPGFFRAWGRVVGQMHALSATYPQSPEVAHWSDEHQHFTTVCQDVEIGDVWVEIGQQVARLPETQGAFGLIHNDPHPWNFLVDGASDSPDAITVLDFDVCNRHFFMTDIGIALFHPIWETRKLPAEEHAAFAQAFRGAWLDGYAEAHTLDPWWVQQLPLFVRYRQVLFFLALSEEYRGNDKARPFLDELRHYIIDGVPLPGLDMHG